MVGNEITTANGGCCTYVSYEGIARIVKVVQSLDSLAQSKVIGGPGYEGHEVWFRFIPKSDVPHDHIRSVISREHLFTLYNSWYIGPRYLEKYGIQTGEIYPCVLKVLVKGACSPVVFEFGTINQTDYFESRS